MREQQGQTLVINVNLTRGLVTLLTGVLLLVALLGYLAWGQREAAASSSQAPLAASTSMRRYYLAGAVLDATQAISACADGYHMASLWEILDTSNLKYNASLGLWQGDSRPGPPTVWQGWVRTGHGTNNGTTPGQANCNAWSTTSGDGTTAGLPANWTGVAEIHVWNVSTWSCGLPAKVWCVED